MTALLQSGALIAVIVLLMAAEIVVLYRRHRTTATSASISAFLPNLLAGLFLMCGIQLAIWDAPSTALLGCLTMAGLCHVFDEYAQVLLFLLLDQLFLCVCLPRKCLDVLVFTHLNELFASLVAVVPEILQ